jgi:23S rRNA (guanosine2251-2'-O)-methyltransferase
MNKESFPADGTHRNGVKPPDASAAPSSSQVSQDLGSAEVSFIERRQGDRRQGDRRVEERRAGDRRDSEDRRANDRRFLTMEELEERDNETTGMRRETGLWPSLDWRPGDKRMTQRRASERRINDRRYEDRRKNDRRARGRRASDVREDLYHGQIQLDEDIDDLAEAGDYKGGSD